MLDHEHPTDLAIRHILRPGILFSTTPEGQELWFRIEFTVFLDEGLLGL